jgi:predicted nucleic acid-binding protein
VDRIFLDANVLVSAALTPGSRLHELWDRPNLRLLGSPYVVMEARRNVTEAIAAARLEGLIARLTVLPAEPADFPLAPDPGLPLKDRPVLLAAVAAQADYLLTGDATHFGALFDRSYGGVTVLRPGEYLRTR